MPNRGLRSRQARRRRTIRSTVRSEPVRAPAPASTTRRRAPPRPPRAPARASCSGAWRSRLGHHRRAGRHLLQQPLGPLHVHAEVAQVAIVHADQPRPDAAPRRASSSRSCTSTSTSRPSPSARSCSDASSCLLERRHDQQHRVGAGDHSLIQLIGIDDEVLAQDRQPACAASGAMSAKRPIEVGPLGQHRQRTRPATLVGRGDRSEIGVPSRRLPAEGERRLNSAITPIPGRSSAWRKRPAAWRTDATSIEHPCRSAARWSVSLLLALLQLRTRFGEDALEHSGADSKSPAPRLARGSSRQPAGRMACGWPARNVRARPTRRPDAIAARAASTPLAIESAAPAA